MIPYALGEEAPPRDYGPVRDDIDEELHYDRVLRRRRGASGLAVSVAAWLRQHEGELVECEHHNGRARLTASACADRYRRAREGWVDQLNIHENCKAPLRMSLAVCAHCPVGAYNARLTPPKRRPDVTGRPSRSRQAPARVAAKHLGL
jgi:hypothetical protein